MNLKDQGRREPTMADLEAFERLLRDSLQSSPQPQPVVQQPAAQPYAPPAAEASRGLDANAMDELTRLIHEPLSFDVPATTTSRPASMQPAAPVMHPAALPVAPDYGAEPLQSKPAYDSTFTWQQLEAIPPAGEPERTVFSPRAPEPAPLDPLSDFENELRRFDDRPAMQTDYPELRADFPGSAEPTIVVPAQQQSDVDYWQAEQALQAEAPPSALDEAERRLAAQAALAAAAAGALGAGAAAASTKGRSRAVFLGLGGVAAIGLTVIAGTLFFGERKANTGGVPVVVAKTEPTKERPANPGGVEIPDQNRQVLAPKTAAEPPKPAQAVNTTEQPMDLNQVTRRDNVRVITPSPFQNNTQGQAPVTEAAPPTTEPASTEPRRVQSVRIGETSPPVAQPTTPGISAGAVAAGAAGAATIAAIAASRSGAQTPPAGATPGRVMTAPTAALPQAQPPAPTAPPKVETRPQSAVAAATTPPRPATPPVARPAQPAAAPTPRAANAPLPLTNNRPASAPAAAPASGGGGWAIQLASRPTQEDARSAASQLGGRFSGALGGRSPGVVSGEANGRTVYRVRASGYSQADANAACDRVKAAGGQCFVTR